MSINKFDTIFNTQIEKIKDTLPEGESENKHVAMILHSFILEYFYHKKISSSEQDHPPAYTEASTFSHITDLPINSAANEIIMNACIRIMTTDEAINYDDNERNYLTNKALNFIAQHHPNHQIRKDASTYQQINDNISQTANYLTQRSFSQRYGRRLFYLGLAVACISAFILAPAGAAIVLTSPFLLLLAIKMGIAGAGVAMCGATLEEVGKLNKKQNHANQYVRLFCRHYQQKMPAPSAPEQTDKLATDYQSPQLVAS